MEDRKNKEDRTRTDEPEELYNRAGSNEHNNYRITNPERKETGTPKKDEKNSYMDYNGNSEENDPSAS